MRTAAIALAVTLVAGIAVAQDDDTVEELASEEEVASIMETLAKISCTADEVEKETDELYEIDDAECEIGQYDIKLDQNFDIISMTKDF